MSNGLDRRQSQENVLDSPDSSRREQKEETKKTENTLGCLTLLIAA
jgi:hypothetical protein